MVQTRLQNEGVGAALDSRAECPDMVRKVALAIRRHRMEKAGILYEYREDIDPSDDFIAEVKVAIEAMREPTARMLASAQWYLTGHNLTVNLCVDANRDAAKVWGRMIDAAVKP